jgi:hypothetical protein
LDGSNGTVEVRLEAFEVRDEGADGRKDRPSFL